MDRAQFTQEIQHFSERWFSVTLTDHQLEWLWFIYENNWVLLLAPRGHGKTTVIVVFITWLICNDPSLRTLIGMHKEEDADERARAIQVILEDPDVQEEYGLQKGRPWRISRAFFEGHRHPYMRTVAKQAGMTGWRGDIVFFDDLLTAENQSTEKRRRRLENWIWGEVMPALDPGPKQRVIVLGTRKHIDDWYKKLIEETPDFTHRVYKIYEDDPSQALWPERFTPEVIAKLKRNWPPEYFAREYMNSPFVAEGLRFKREWLQFYTGRVPVEDRFLRYYMGIDPSMGSKRDRSSSAAIVVIAFDSRPGRQDIYVVDMVKEKLSLAEQEDLIQSYFGKWTIEGRAPKVLMENVLVNKSFADRMKRQLPVISTVDYVHSGLKGTSDMSKIGRIENIVGWLCKKGKVHFKTVLESPMTRRFIEEEYVQFPEGDMDLLDALNLACDRVDLRSKLTDFKLWKF